jgi:hypothetical protein
VQRKLPRGASTRDSASTLADSLMTSPGMDSMRRHGWRQYDSMQGGSTTPWMESVERRREQAVECNASSSCRGWTYGEVCSRWRTKRTTLIPLIRRFLRLTLRAGYAVRA